MKIPKELTTVTLTSKIVTFIFIITLPFIGFFAGIKYQSFISNNATVSYEPSKDTNIKPTSLVENPDLTKSWKTYTNTKYGYSFKYPADWFIYPEGASSTGGENNTAIASGDITQRYTKKSLSITRIDVKVEDLKVPFSTYLVNRPENDAKISAKKITIDNVEGEEWQIKGEGISTLIFLPQGNKVISIIGPASSTQEYKILATVLSTFTFLNQNKPTVTITASKITIPSDWKQFTGKDSQAKLQTTLSVPPGFSFGFSGSEWSINDNATSNEIWDYSSSILFDVNAQPYNSYEESSRREWYKRYLDGEFSQNKPPIKFGEILAVKENFIGSTSYLDVTVKTVSGKIEHHYIYAQNGIIHIIKPVSQVADSESSVIAKDIGIIFYSLSSTASQPYRGK